MTFRKLIESSSAELLVEFSNQCVDRAVTNHVLSCGIYDVELWALRWLDGKNRSYRSAYNAAIIIRSFLQDARVIKSASVCVFNRAINAAFSAEYAANGDSESAIRLAAKSADDTIVERRWQSDTLERMIKEA